MIHFSYQIVETFAVSDETMNISSVIITEASKFFVGQSSNIFYNIFGLVDWLVSDIMLPKNSILLKAYLNLICFSFKFALANISEISCNS